VFYQPGLNYRLVKHQDGVALFRAEIKLPEGGSATGWGASRDPYAGQRSHAETSLGYITEAENQALDRALAVLGYGIEYATDFDAPDEGESIPLRESEEGQNIEEPGIEVPMDVVGEEEAEEIAGTVRMPVEPPRPIPPHEEEEEVEEEEEEAPKAPTPLRTVYEEPTRFSAEPTPLRPNRPAPAAPNPPTPITSRPAPVRRPGPTPVEPPAAPTPPPPTPLTSTAVEERLKEVTDERLRLAIKQIFHEARRLHSLSEDAVDRSSQKRYGVPVNRLTLEQANEYLERIKTATRTPRK
jgi:hypothetical protein